MGKTANQAPRGSQLRAMRALWGGARKAEEVARELDCRISTAQTHLTRLEEKGLVSRPRKEGNAWIWRAEIGLHRARRLALEELAEEYFSGAIDGLAMLARFVDEELHGAEG